MKGFLSKLAGLKTRRIPKAPCDSSDFLAAVPDAPSIDHLRSVVEMRHFGGLPAASTFDEQSRRDHIVRGTVFDLKYRCAAAGRCTCAGSPACRFPSCFAMRPLTKGAEIQAERLTYEVEDAPTPEIRALIDLARQERVADAIKGVKHLVDELIKSAANGRPLDATLVVEGQGGSEFSPASTKMGSESKFGGVNPLKDASSSVREDVISLYLWRAALLVNLRRDEEAVNSLLNLAAALDEQHRTKLFGAATSWATLNDMEIVFYRSLSQQYETFDECRMMATERPLLLPRVFEALENDDYHTEYCSHIVFSKEVTATVSRAQASQMHGEKTEDPMKSLCIPLSIPYYRFKVHANFWPHFFNLLCMPPVPPPSPEELEKQQYDPVMELGLTPNHILDAVGRSMLLHHVVLYADTREKEIDSGAVADRVKQMKSAGVEVQKPDYERVLEMRDMSVAVSRMKELLLVVKQYEMKEKLEVAGNEKSTGPLLSQKNPDSPQ